MRGQEPECDTTVGYQPSAECGVRSAESRIFAAHGGEKRFRKVYGAANN